MSNLAFTALGIAFIFAMTTLGAAIVFFFKRDISQKINGIFLGFSAGIMIAASVWSMLIPAIGQGEGKFAFVPAAAGFLLGCAFLYLLGKFFPVGRDGRAAKLFFAVVVHNVPEGLAVGFAFGAAAVAGTSGAFVAALGLAIGIGIQNLPEGAAISLPMKARTGSRGKAFFLGSMSGAVEPVFAVAGYFLASALSVIQPWLLGFAAGAMIFVVAEDMMPEAAEKYPALAAWGMAVGFALMMILDVTLG